MKTELPPPLRPLWEQSVKALAEERAAEAANLLQRFVRAAPGYAPGWNNLGVALRRLKRWEAAAACFARGIALPDGATESAFSNLGNALRDLGRFAEAEAMFRRALAKGGSPGTRYNLSLLLRDMNRVDEALTLLTPLIAAEPGNHQREWDYSLMLLQKGDWERGFAAYEARWHLPGVPPFVSDRPQWDGSPLAGRTLLLLSEQGMGDAIQFARYVPLIARDGGRIAMQVRKPLLNLFAAVPALAGVDLAASEGPLPPHDLCLPLISLTRVLKARPETLPPPLSIDLPKDRLAEAEKLFPPRVGRRRVGIVWAGSPGHRNDRNRSAELAAFRPLFAHPGLDLYSFQVGERARDLAETGLGALVSDLSPRIADFLDTAVLMRQMDLMVAVDTGTVHLAGSLGVPTVVVIPFAVDWRWGEDGATTPWYTSLRLVRQPRQGDWEGAFARVMALLAPPAKPAVKAAGKKEKR
jgi:hypothetical protein